MYQVAKETESGNGNESIIAIMLLVFSFSVSVIMLIQAWFLHKKNNRPRSKMKLIDGGKNAFKKGVFKKNDCKKHSD